MYNLNQHIGASLNLANFALAGLSGAATTHSHTASVPCSIGGVFGTSPSGTTTPTTNSAATQPGANNGIVSGVIAAGSALAGVAPASGFRAALVVWTTNAAGTKIVRSNGFFTALDSGPVALEFPPIPVTEIPLSYHTVKLGTTVSGTWTFGSSNWNATGVTIGTVVNLCGLPSAGSVVVS